MPPGLLSVWQRDGNVTADPPTLLMPTDTSAAAPGEVRVIRDDGRRPVILPRRQFKPQLSAAQGKWRLLIRVTIILLLMAVALRDGFLLLIHSAAIVALAAGLLFLLLSSHNEIQIDSTYLRRISFLGPFRRSARRRISNLERVEIRYAGRTVRRGIEATGAYQLYAVCRRGHGMVLAWGYPKSLLRSVAGFVKQAGMAAEPSLAAPSEAAEPGIGVIDASVIPPAFSAGVQPGPRRARLLESETGIVLLLRWLAGGGWSLRRGVIGCVLWLPLAFFAWGLVVVATMLFLTVFIPLAFRVVLAAANLVGVLLLASPLMVGLLRRRRRVIFVANAAGVTVNWRVWRRHRQCHWPVERIATFAALSAPDKRSRYLVVVDTNLRGHVLVKTGPLKIQTVCWVAEQLRRACGRPVPPAVLALEEEGGGIPIASESLRTAVT